MRKFIIGGIAAFAMAMVPTAVAQTAVAHADGHCSTTPNIFGKGYTIDCDNYGNDGSRSSTTTYCNADGSYCTTDNY
jgi:hypothetical protein